MAAYGEKSFRSMKLVIDNEKYECVRLENAAADDLYNNGRESSTVEHIKSNKVFYGGVDLPTVYNQDGHAIITQRVVILYDEKITTGPVQLGARGKRKAPLIQREVITSKAVNFFGKDSVVLDLEAPPQSPAKPEASEVSLSIAEHVSTPLTTAPSVTAAKPVQVVVMKKNTKFAVPVAKAKPSSTVSSDSQNQIVASTSQGAKSLGSVLNIAVNGSEIKEIERIVEGCIRSMEQTGELNAIICKVFTLPERPKPFTRMEGTTELGDILLEKVGNLIAQLVGAYIKKTGVQITFSRQTTVVQTVAAKVAEKANNFTLIIDTSNDTVKVKGALKASTPAINVPTGPDTLQVGPMVPLVQNERRSWEDWERRCLMQSHETVTARQVLKNFWVEVAKEMVTFGIDVTNIQCRNQHDWLEQRYKKISEDGPSGSGQRKKEPLDDDIVDHFQRLSTVNPRYLFSSMRGPKVVEIQDDGQDGSSAKKKSKKHVKPAKGTVHGADVIVKAMENYQKDSRDFQKQYLAILNRVYPEQPEKPAEVAVVPSTSSTNVDAFARMTANANVSEDDKKQLVSLFAAINKILSKSN